jgi:hypothetical protein
MEDKFSDPEIQQFYKDYAIPAPNFDELLPAIDMRGTNLTMKFAYGIPENLRMNYATNVYGVARFLSDYVKNKIGATKELPEESEWDEGQMVKNYTTVNPTLYFQIHISGPGEMMGNAVYIETEYYLQYMEHSQDYGKKYSKHFTTLTKNGIWDYVLEIADSYIKEVKEYMKWFRDTYDIVEHYLKELREYIKRGNDYEIISNLRAYPEVIQLLGLTEKEADDAHGMNQMGFAD